MATTKNTKKETLKTAKKETTKETVSLMKKAPMKPAAKTSAKSVAPTAKSTKKAEPKVKLEIAPKGKKADAKTAAPLKAGKKDKKSEILEVVATIVPNVEAMEEEEELAMAAAAAKKSSGSAEAGLATAAAETAAGSLKNFRQHPDLENFYRFIFENDLRYEAMEIIDVIISQRGGIKNSKMVGTKTK